uniref:Uncharacterized protein n=1 Tax=Panagrolaimus sp. PS1159 TaxID=55785 RepID=A0AC35FL56_9BILA
MFTYNSLGLKNIKNNNLFILLIFVIININVVNAKYFVYKNAPSDMINAAKQIGENERLSYQQSLQKAESDDESIK